MVELDILCNNLGILFLDCLKSKNKSFSHMTGAKTIIILSVWGMG